MVIQVALLWTIGVLIAIPVIAWWARDISRIPRRAFYWTGYHLRPWQWAVLLGWIAGGWPAIVIVLVWSRSAERRDLQEEANEIRRDRTRSSDR